jgi:competence protein ComEA
MRTRGLYVLGSWIALGVAGPACAAAQVEASQALPSHAAGAARPTQQTASVNHATVRASGETRSAEAPGAARAALAEGENGTGTGDAAAPVAAAGTATSAAVDLNRATAEELERLPSIGPCRARAILELRARLGRFQRVEQLLQVKGIGRATFRKLRPLVTI